MSIWNRIHEDPRTWDCAHYQQACEYLCFLRLANEGSDEMEGIEEEMDSMVARISTYHRRKFNEAKSLNLETLRALGLVA